MISDLDIEIRRTTALQHEKRRNSFLGEFHRFLHGKYFLISLALSVRSSFLYLYIEKSFSAFLPIIVLQYGDQLCPAVCVNSLPQQRLVRFRKRGNADADFKIW